ncbi:glycoside hydrolase [Lentinus tigrinus ALCF2SS1-7]|uniref:non-reducing end alpha-L-arabinofuranosidase n=1 Tax=Lentinus tigrinus ALCF2SS1-6 TaxID=1328759 RepID=A0A5C2SX41_9APHY|nr:glycoside hydrolase [Lentinus tigrinus ALCF2SS1-6]RPD79007.1 glycoside hydrolase [Lentinus tigrinus ALCF2SS1-7]
MRLGFLNTLLLGSFVASCLAVTVTVNKTPSHSVPSTLCESRHSARISGDGGLYAELLQNRAFQQVTPNTTAALNAWSALNGARLTVIADPTPVSKALPNSLQFTVPSGSSGAVGFTNAGFWGIKVDSASTYKASFYYRFPASSSFSGTLTVGLRANSNGATLASATTTIHGTTTNWTQVNLSFKPAASAPNVANSFFVSIDGGAAAGQTINFAMFSLFPPTYKNRPNGMRVDIAEALAEMGPAFFRFPGGNNLVCRSFTPGTRWQWNATVGSLLDRPGRAGDWGYVNTDGLGLLEYLEFFEDVGMEPIMAVWSGDRVSGYALGGTSEPESQLAPFIQQAKDQINFVIGDPATSAPAALRASLGHPEPFTLRFVEIGNEDFIGSAPSTYPYRWRDFFGNLSAEFPQIRFLATSDVGSPILSPAPPAYDVHVYQTPTWFYQNAFYYDSFQRDGTTYFEGEYAAISTNASNLFGTPAQGRLLWPTMASSSGEAAFMTGLERNSDIVFAASYAPLLQHVNSTQWTPDLVSFDAGSVIRSTSYYVQKLFATNVGDQYLPSTLPTNGNTLHWSITRSFSSGATFIKVANAGSATASLTFDLSQFSTVASSGTLQLLTGAQTASNTPAAPNTITPKTSTVSTGKSFTYNAPAFSVSVITVTTH